MEVIFKEFSRFVDQLVDISISKLKWREKRQDVLITKTKEHQFTLLDLKKNLKNPNEDGLYQNFNVAETLRDSIIDNTLSPTLKYRKVFLSCSTFRNYWPRNNNIFTRTRNFFDDSNQNGVQFKFNPTQADIALMPKNIQETTQTNRKMAVNSPSRKKELLKQISKQKIRHSIYNSEDNDPKASREFKNQCKDTFIITSKSSYFNKSLFQKSIRQNTLDLRRMEQLSPILSKNSEINKSQINYLFTPHENESG